MKKVAFLLAIEIVVMIGIGIRLGGPEQSGRANGVTAPFYGLISR